MKNILRMFTAILISIACTTTTFALPSATQIEDTGYDQFDNIHAIRDITITDDPVTPTIKAAVGIKIVIPNDFPAIWDRSYNYVTMSGTAVDAKNISDTATATFDSTAKIATIPVLKDFQAGQLVTIARLTLKGFYTSTSADQFLGLSVSADDSVIAKSNRSMYVRTRSVSDNNPPETPEKFTSSVVNKAITLSWNLSVDKDVSQQELFRGTASDPFTIYQILDATTTTYTDTNVQEGKTYMYKLRVSDGRNYSDFTPLLTVKNESIVITPLPSTPTQTPESPFICTMEYAPVCAEGKTYSNACMAQADGKNVFTNGECISPSQESKPSTKDFTEDAQKFIQEKDPLKRLKAIKAAMKNLEFKDKARLMRAVIKALMQK